ncbi:phosphatase, partial [Streptomyces sp. BE133]|nr:phosphatase [Streptomyces sp. BE133]
TSHGADLTLLVIENDPAGTFTVPELQAAAGTRVRIRTARNRTAARRLLTADVDCIQLDLALPTGSAARSAPAGTSPCRARARCRSLAWSARTSRGLPGPADQ